MNKINDKKKVVIIGAGGHGKVIADIVQGSGDYVIGFLDDAENIVESYVGFPILGKISDYYMYQDDFFVIAIGNSKIREKVANKLKNVKWYNAIHPSAVISTLDTEIAEGTVVMANAVINPGTKVGKHCIINSGAIVEHDNVIDAYSHISVGAKLAGTVNVGSHTWVGIGATISNNINICGECTIGAGAVVVKDITNPGIYVGVPAKKR